jgi:hypothetical protein
MNDMTANVNSVSSKLDAVTAKLEQAMAFIAKQTPLELSVAKQVQENGGEKALQVRSCLNKKSCWAEKLNGRRTPHF